MASDELAEKVRALMAPIETMRQAAVDRVIDHYRPEIERAMQRFDRYAESMIWRQMQHDIEVATRPYARELARLTTMLPIRCRIDYSGRVVADDPDEEAIMNAAG